MTILDDTIFRGPRNLSIRLRNNDDNGVRIDDNMHSVDVTIDVDTDDGMSIALQFIYNTARL